jgi:uncharacterized protein YndB with AHSA1/START domain
MANILHRLTIDASPERVHELIATKSGVERWWTGRPVTGDDAVGGRIAVYFGDSERAAAVFEIVESTRQRVVWRCVEGPADWLETRISYAVNPRDDGGTTLLFSHEGWAEENEFMHGCSTNWASYLMSLKAGAQTEAFTPFPGGEISRWD